MANFIRYSRLISGRSVTKGANKPSNPKGTGGSGAIHGGSGGSGALQGMTVTSPATDFTVTGVGLELGPVTANVGDMIIVITGANGGSFIGGGFGAIDEAVGSTNVWNIRTRTISGIGAEIAVIDCVLTTALDEATISIVGATGQWSTGRVYRIVPSAGSVSHVATGTVAGTTTTAHNASTVSVTDKQIIFGIAAINTDDTITLDSDTTNGNWSSETVVLADGGLDSQSCSLVTQWKIVNATGNQSWGVTTVSSRSSARNYLIYQAA